MSGDIDKTDAALIRKDIEHLASDVQAGFEGTNRRLDKLNGSVAEHTGSIHDLDQRTVIMETRCAERTTGYKEAREEVAEVTKTNAQVLAQAISSPGAKVGIGGGLTGAAVIIMLLLRAWGYL